MRVNGDWRVNRHMCAALLIVFASQSQTFVRSNGLFPGNGHGDALAVFELVLAHLHPLGREGQIVEQHAGLRDVCNFGFAEQYALLMLTFEPKSVSGDICETASGDIGLKTSRMVHADAHIRGLGLQKSDRPYIVESKRV